MFAVNRTYRWVVWFWEAEFGGFDCGCDGEESAVDGFYVGVCVLSDFGVYAICADEQTRFFSRPIRESEDHAIVILAYDFSKLSIILHFNASLLDCISQFAKEDFAVYTQSVEAEEFLVAEVVFVDGVVLVVFVDELGEEEAVGFDAGVDAEGGEDGEGVGTEHEGAFGVGGWGAEFVDCGRDGVGVEGEGEGEALRSVSIFLV